MAPDWSQGPIEQMRSRTPTSCAGSSRPEIPAAAVRLLDLGSAMVDSESTGGRRAGAHGRESHRAVGRELGAARSRKPRPGLVPKGSLGIWRWAGSSAAGGRRGAHLGPVA